MVGAGMNHSYCLEKIIDRDVFQVEGGWGQTLVNFKLLRKVHHLSCHPINLVLALLLDKLQLSIKQTDQSLINAVHRIKEHHIQRLFILFFHFEVVGLIDLRNRVSQVAQLGHVLLSQCKAVII